MVSSFRIVYSSRFDSELLGIYDYISEELNNPEAASKQIALIMSRAESLSSSQKRYRVRFKDTDGNDIRILPAKNYVILYSVDDEKLIVNISSVIYGKRNIDNLI